MTLATIFQKRHYMYLGGEMPDLQSSDTFGSDDFHQKLMKGKGVDLASPKMSEYIEMMEAYLLVREKSVLEKTNAKNIKMS